MPNNTQHIQLPSFNDFSGDYEQKQITNTHTTQQLDTTTEHIYQFPLSIINHTNGIWFNIFSIALTISAIMFTVILYSLFRVVQIRLKEKEDFLKAPMSPQAELLLGHKINPSSNTNTAGERARQRWQQIEDHMLAGTTSDWRLAIIEADIMLDELVTSLGYKGDTLGDKLKQIRPESLNSIEHAWEAHKVRNKIAHQGAELVLDEREVKRVMHLYKQVFQEAKFI